MGKDDVCLGMVKVLVILYVCARATLMIAIGFFRLRCCRGGCDMLTVGGVSACSVYEEQDDGSDGGKFDVLGCADDDELSFGGR